MIYILMLLAGLAALVFTLPKYEVKVGDTVVWGSAVWVVASARRNKYTLVQRKQGSTLVEYDVPKRQLVVVE